MWSGVVEVMSTAAPLEASALMVLSGARRRANASAVAMSHWSMSALIGSSRTRIARIGILPSWGRPSANWRRRRVESSSSSHRDGQVEQGDAVQAVRRHDVVAGREVPAVDDQQDVRRRGPLVGAEAGPVAEVGRQQVAEVVDRGGDQPHRADRVDLARALGVGQPLDPVPVGEVLLRAEDRDDELVGVVEGGGRQDHRAGRGAGLVLGTADLDAVEGAQVDGGRQVGLHPVHDEEPVERRRGGRVDLVDGRALRRDQLGRQRLGAQAVAHVHEVGVARAVLPQAGALLGQRREGGGLGVVPVEGPALLLGGVARHLADVGEVAEVLRARAGHLLRPLLTLPVDLHDDEAERGEEEHAGREEAAGLVGAAAHGRHEHDRAEAAEHRDRVHQDAAGALALLDLRRRLEDDLAPGHLRLVEPVAPTQCRAHTFPLAIPEWSR